MASSSSFGLASPSPIKSNDSRGGIPSDMVPSPLKPRSATRSTSLERSLLEEELAEAERNGDLVEEISFLAPMAGPTVAAQEQQRMTELADLRKATASLLDNWTSAKGVDAKFDEVTITEQIDAILPPVMETEPEIKKAEALRADEVVQDYAELKALLRRLSSNELLPYADAVDLARAVTEAVRKASSTLSGTRNKTAAAEFLSVSGSIIEKIQQLFDIQIPDSKLLHQRAEASSADCGVFEGKRASDDWSTELAREESHVYNAVADLLSRIGLTLEDCERIHATLSSYKINPVQLDEHRFDADLATVSSALNRLREREEAEARHYAQIQRSLAAQVDKYSRAAAGSQAIASKLTAHINNLLGDLADAHLSAWRDAKRVQIAERSMMLLDKKQSVNSALASGEEEELAALLRDIQAADAAAKILDELTHSSAAELRKQAKAREARLVGDMVELYHDRLELVKRKYVQATQAVFASEASIEILKQEIEGAYVKKARANAAKQPERVADANEEVRVLEERVAQEQVTLQALRAEVGGLRDDFEITFEKTARLSLSPELRDRLVPIQEAWLDLLSDLKVAEKSQLSAVHLANKLDASFLNH